MPDLYELLGVPRDASAEDIKRAYRRQARQHHPDAGGDEDTFKQITHAYQVLSDPQKRARYDRFGDDGTPQSRGAGQDPFGFGAGGFGGIGDVIDAFFGSAFGGATGATGGSGRGRTTPGRDVLVGVELELEDVVTGVRREVEVEVATPCDLCGGSGSASGRPPSACATCGGSGQVQRVVRTAFGQLATAAPCTSCEGTGRKVADPCTGCGGEGRRVQRRTLGIDVPAGVEEGDRLRVPGAGEAGRHGAPPGDLYVEVHLAPHEWFERDGRDLVAEITVPVTQAALGGSVTVPTVDGAEVEVEVPAGTQNGEELLIRRAGLPNTANGRRGDLRLVVRVEVPMGLSTEQRDLLARLAELRDEPLAADGRGLFTRLRDAFQR
ncbi:molecular chaperone DnaJ [Egicoccus sp. AB-alg2]|uniref:molecular chaperone DnaJ n=1 Tax=Egicoccus sp. AB-alg2 TaxID=3242693 RepID=UPI00359D872D